MTNPLPETKPQRAGHPRVKKLPPDFPIDSLWCGRIDGCDKFGTGGFEQALVGANKSQRLWAYRCSHQQATCKLNGVVGPERITINHLRGNIKDEVSYRLPEEPSFCVLL